MTDILLTQIVHNISETLFEEAVFPSSVLQKPEVNHSNFVMYDYLVMGTFCALTASRWRILYALPFPEINTAMVQAIRYMPTKSYLENFRISRIKYALRRGPLPAA